MGKENYLSAARMVSVTKLEDRAKQPD